MPRTQWRQPAGAGAAFDSEQPPGIPTRAQDALLKAAFAPDAGFEAAWSNWCTIAGREGVERQSYQLLQLLAPRLRGRAADEPYVRLCREHYRLTWAKTKTMLRTQEAVLGAMNRANIPTLLLKGAALVPLYYRDHGLRTMGDVDILVRNDAFGAAMQVLQAAGWNKVTPQEVFDSRFLHAITLTNAMGDFVDLHGHVLVSSSGPDDDRRFWDHAVPLAAGTQPALTLSSSHHLIHQIAHGLGGTEPAVRWVADCVTIIRAGPIDWDEVVETSMEVEIAPIIASALDYLSHNLAAPVPKQTLEQLHNIRTSARRRRQLRLETMKLDGRILDSIAYHWQRLRRGAGNSVPRALMLLPTYLRVRVRAGGFGSAFVWISDWIFRHTRHKFARKARAKNSSHSIAHTPASPSPDRDGA